MRKQYNLWPWPTADGRTDAWDVDRLIELSRNLPVEQVPLESIWQLDDPYWGIVTPRDLARHTRLVEDADLRFPVILAADGRVMDGMHRIIRALMDGRATIAAFRFETQPDPDFRNCDPNALLYADPT